MLSRNFRATDLRVMLEDATGDHEDQEPGRYVNESRHGGTLWHVAVEPQVDEETLVVVTAYKPD